DYCETHTCVHKPGFITILDRPGEAAHVQQALLKYQNDPKVSQIQSNGHFCTYFVDRGVIVYRVEWMTTSSWKRTTGNVESTSYQIEGAAPGLTGSGIDRPGTSDQTLTPGQIMALNARFPKQDTIRAGGVRFNMYEFKVPPGFDKAPLPGAPPELPPLL